MQEGLFRLCRFQDTEAKYASIYTNFQNQTDFFQALVFAKYKKASDASSETDKTIVCKTVSVAVWLPDSESNPDPGSGAGHWGTHSVIKCKQVLDNCSGVVGPDGQCITGGNGGDPGEFPYPGGGGGTPETPEESPCEKLKAQKVDIVYKSRITYLKSKLNDTREYGFRIGNPVSGTGQTAAQYQELSNASGTQIINFQIFNTIYGYIHSHFNKLIPIFSPGDINTFIKLLKNAQNNGIPLGNVFMTVVNSDGTIYQLRGDDGMDISGLSIFPQTTIDDILNGIYLGKDFNLEKADQSPEYYQEQFLKFMTEYMNIDGASMYKINDNGDSFQLRLSGNSLATPIPCP